MRPRLLAGLLPLCALAVSARAETHRYVQKAGYPTFAVRPPVLTVKPGDVLESETLWGEWYEKAGGKWPGEVGPIAIEGAEPGDTLSVHIDKIDLNREFGWGGAIPYFGLMAPEYKTAMITPPVPDHLYAWRLDKSRKVGTLDMPNSKIGKVEVPLRPFFGTIGTAPAGKECISSLVPGSHGANMDFNEVVEGVTMMFPVYEKGALFMLGDGHAAQGDGEIMGAAIETSFNVRFTVNVIKGKKIGWPRLINDKYIMSIGSTRPLIDALRLACVDMINWLHDDYGYDKVEALQLLGQTAVLKIANVVDPQFSVACALDKKYLPK